MKRTHVKLYKQFNKTSLIVPSCDKFNFPPKGFHVISFHNVACCMLKGLVFCYVINWVLSSTFGLICCKFYSTNLVPAH